MTLEVKYKNRCDYSYISGDVLEIRDFNKKEIKYVLIKEKDYKKLLKELEDSKKQPSLFKWRNAMETKNKRNYYIKFHTKPLMLERQILKITQSISLCVKYVN